MGNNMTKISMISYTVASSEDDICTDILFETANQASSAAIEDGFNSYKFEWDGKDAQTIRNIEEIK